jgi:hypothetical protein
VVSLPIAWASVRAAAGNWVPTGDDAYFTVRSRDVLTASHPLLGAWSSGSTALDTPINNVGPIQLDLLAAFTRWTPMGGTAIGVAVTNIAAIAVIAWLVARLAGHRAVLPAMIGLGLMTWTMGSEMLITPRQHQYLILPFLCLLVSAWGVVAGDRWAIVPAVVAASLVAQTHLSYPVLVGALTVLMAVGHVVATRRGEAIGGRRPLVVSGVLLALLWLQTLVDQLFGWGNFGHVLFGSGGAGRAGLGNGARIVAATLASLDTVVRPGYSNQDHQARLAAAWQSVVFWIAVVTAIVLVTRSIRNGAWRAASGWLVGVVAVLAGVVNAAMLPETQFGLAIMNYRWLWALGAYLLMLGLLWLVPAFERWVPSLACRTRSLLLMSCVALGVINLPRSVQNIEAERYLSEQRNVAAVLDQLDRSLDRGGVQGPVLIDESAMYFGHPYTYPVLVQLQQHGIEFRFEQSAQERRFGSRRLADGTETETLRLVAGEPAIDLAASDGPDVLAQVGGERPVAIVLVGLGR